MTVPFDLSAAAGELARQLSGVHDDDLTRATPCHDYTLGDLVEHVYGLTLAFTDAATRAVRDGAARGPAGDVRRLPATWRSDLQGRLDALVEAWRDPGAWEGVTSVGGVELPGPAAAAVGLDELVVHGWDISRATGEEYRADATSVEVCLQFVASTADPEQRAANPGLFGPVRPVAEHAAPIDRLIAMTGRDPDWATP